MMHIMHLCCCHHRCTHINEFSTSSRTAAKVAGIGSIISTTIDILCIVSDNKNVESKTRSVVKYVINNIMSTSLMGQRDGYVLAFCALVTV